MKKFFFWNFYIVFASFHLNGPKNEKEKEKTFNSVPIRITGRKCFLIPMDSISCQLCFNFTFPIMLVLCCTRFRHFKFYTPACSCIICVYSTEGAFQKLFERKDRGNNGKHRNEEFQFLLCFHFKHKRESECRSYMLGIFRKWFLLFSYMCYSYAKQFVMRTFRCSYFIYYLWELVLRQ